MKKLKRIISVLLTAAVFTALLPSAFAAKNSRDEDIMALLSELGIMVGDADGNMRLDDYVTRAEFAKIAIKSSSSKDTVAAGMKVSPFRDVTYSHWSAPYVQAAVSSGIVTGYVDGTFRPDNTVLYEEAITMILKVLGYADSDFGTSWPYGQMGLADNLDITDNVNASQGEPLTRRQVANMVYNTLNTKMKNSQAKLVTIFDCTPIEDSKVISTSDEDSSLGSDKVFTSAGSYTKGDYLKSVSVGQEGTMFIKNTNKLVAFVPDDDYSKGYDKYVVYSVLPDSVVGYNNGRFEQIDIADHTTVYRNQTASTFAAVKNSFEMGDVLYVKYTDGGSIDYVTYEDGNMEGPIKVTSSNWMSSFDTDSSTTIMRSGVKSTASDIQTNDIIYYSPDLNMILAYTDKVTGIYEKATPTKDSPTSVTISGKEYAVESVEAFNDLSSSGSFSYGDTITVLLGRDGSVAGVAGGSASAGGTDGAFVLETGRKTFTNPDGTEYIDYYAKVVTPDGTVQEYATNDDYDYLVCSVVRITFKDGIAWFTKSRTSTSSSTISGKVSASKNTIGSAEVSDDVKILDTSGTDSDDVGTYARVYMQRLDGITLKSSNVLYYSKNSAGEIEEIILRDVTGDACSYGIVTKSNSDTGTFTVDIDGSVNTFSSGYTSRATGPHKFRMGAGKVDYMQQLSSYSTNISELTRTEATIGGQKYLLSDKVLVYHRSTASTYMKMTLDDAINGDYRLTAYYDKTQANGGRIRIIIATDK